MSDANPFAAPYDRYEAVDAAVEMRDYGGIGRLQYFGFSVLLSIITNVLQFAIVSADLPAVGIVLGLLGLGGSIVLIVQRLKNLGYSGWWAFGFIVPILNILVGLRCLAAPEGYADHKTLDGPAKVILGIFVGVIVLAIAAAILLSSR